MNDLKLAVDTLHAKTIDYTPLFDYYSGDQPLQYAAERLREIFQSRQTRFTQNWCAVVVDAILDRLMLDRWSLGDAEADELNQLWQTTGLDMDADAVARAVLITGEAYVLAWPAGDAGPEAYYHDPRIAHLWYAADNPRQKRLGAKWWRADDAWRLNLYYPDHIQRYIGGASDVPQPSSFTLEADDPNPYGVIPLFHFYRDRHLLPNVLQNVLPLQDAINKLLGDMMIAAEFGAFRQRWIITNSDTAKLRNAPNEIWELPAAMQDDQPTTVGEFSTTDLANYLNAIDNLAASIGIITQTPRHYFYGQGGDPSGEALIALEAPLNRRVEQYQRALGATWRAVMAFLAAIPDPLAITPAWTPAATVQPRTQAEIRQINVAAGLPLTTQLRDEGWSDADLAQLQADKDAEADAQQTQLASAMLRAQTQFNTGAE